MPTKKASEELPSILKMTGRKLATQEELYQRIAALMDNGPDDPQIQAAVGEWRQLISDRFYHCTLEIFRGLGDLYVNDERFTANFEKYRPGLAKFMREAIHVYCDPQTQ